MGYIASEFYIVDYYCREWEQLNGRKPKMLELGDQIFYGNLINSGYAVAKDYFQSKGIDHTSIDLNGLNGSISLDMSKPLPDEYHNNFDILTNVGMTEHIKQNQVQAFKNIHDSVRVGGLFMHFVPMIDNFNKAHCDYFYSDTFFAKLARLNGYIMLFNGQITYESEQFGILTCAVMRKMTNNTFKPGKLFETDVIK